jgi:hypothetical protein
VLAKRTSPADAKASKSLRAEQDDLDALVKECAGEAAVDERMLRVNGVAAFYEDWKRP